MPLAWLAVFVTTVGGLLEGDLGPNAPITNIRVDPRLGRVSWDLNGSVAEVTCSRGSDYTTWAKANNTYCDFHAFSLCEPTDYTIRVTRGPPFSTVVRYPKPGGRPGAAAENLTCWIRDLDFLDCSWAVGHAAPRDIQYRLYLTEPGTHKELECLLYTADARGIHTHCRFGDISQVSRHYHQHRFLVTGTAGEPGIPCTERFALLSDIEILAPPSIRGRCNMSHSVLEWDMSSHFIKDFTYELQIFKGTDTTPIDTVSVTGKNSNELVNPGTFTVKIRAKEDMAHFGTGWSAWSSPLHLECDKEDRSLWQMTLFTALGTVLSVLLVALLCWRFSVSQKIFPPIPRIKDSVRDFFQDDKLVVWEVDQESWEDCPVEEVHAVGET